MVRQRTRILLIEDNSDHAALIRRHIASVTHRMLHLEWVQTLSEGFERLARGDVGVILLDLGLPDSDPSETLSHVVARSPDTPIVVLTALNDMDLATTAVQQGAQDYLVKSQINGELLVRSVQYAIERKWTEQRLKELNATLEERVQQRTHEAERRADQLKRLAAELTQAEQRERRRLAEILHDHLQQLLVAAKMNADGLRRKSSDPDVQQSMQQICQLLDESIQASRSLTVELSPPVLYELGLGAAIRWLAQQQQQKYGLNIEVESDEEAEPDNDQTRALLFQAVRELLFNVIKYANVDRAHVSLTQHDENQLCITVLDNGVGFDPRSLESAGDAGGFGLFSIRERLDVLGGRMLVDAKPGGGTRITLLAPRFVPQAEVAAPSPLAHEQKAPPAGALASGRQALRVLLAEDQQLLRKGLARLLREHDDLELVGEAPDGETAIALCAEQRPDVVVMDVSMPRLDGIQATRQILENFPDTRVIGLSMHGENGMAEAMLKAGAAFYLPKDGPIERLLEVIRAQGPGFNPSPVPRPE